MFGFSRESGVVFVSDKEKYDITRMTGSRGAYHVSVREGKGFREFHTFKTIKAAVEFIETAL